MSARTLARILGLSAVPVWALLTAPIQAPAASADPCSDIAVVFARGSNQPPGLGDVGQAFVDSLTSQVGGRSVNTYAVNYPASNDYHNSVPAGSSDASAHIQDVVASCPNSKIVLGGYSQGSTVIDLASQTLPPAATDRVAAVALFGEPTSGFSSMLWGSQPLPTISPALAGKTTSLCAPDDLFCSPGGNLMTHMTYVSSGLVNQAASFVASKLGGAPAPNA
jgi:cutinase